MLAYALYTFLCGFALFLLGFSIFMYFEGRKFGDNQFTVKLLPPPPRVADSASIHDVLVEPVSTEMPAFSEAEIASPQFIRAA